MTTTELPASVLQVWYRRYVADATTRLADATTRVASAQHYMRWKQLLHRELHRMAPTEQLHWFIERMPSMAMELTAYDLLLALKYFEHGNKQ